MINRFDDVANTWDARPDQVILAEKFAGRIKKIIRGKNVKTVLEYGCGTGNVSFYLQDCFETVILADASVGMIHETQTKTDINGINHFFPKLLDLEKENYKGSFDMIYTLMTLHHVQKIELVLRKFSEMLNPEGLLIIGDLKKEDGNFHPFSESEAVHFGFEKAEINTMLQNNNMKVLHNKGFHNMERNHTGTSKKYPVFILKSIKK